MKPHRPLQEVEGHVSVYAVMERFGYVQTGRAWKKLLGKHHQTLPGVKMMRFIGVDGRKGKLVPAVHLSDLDSLIRHFEAIDWQEDQVTFVRPAVEQVLQVVALAFQDHDPVSQVRLDDVLVDLHLRKIHLALLYRSAEENQSDSSPLLLDGNVRVVVFDPYHEHFTVGQLVYELRQHVENRPVGDSGLLSQG